MALEQGPKKKKLPSLRSPGEIQGEKPLSNPQILSIKLGHKKKSLIIEKALNQNVMYITGNLLKSFWTERKCFQDKP